MIYRQDQHCQFCQHYRGERKCLAFPGEIPDPLWTGENWHRDAYPGDHGFRFARKLLERPEIPQGVFDEWAKQGTRQKA